MMVRQQAANRMVGDDVCHIGRRVWAVGSKPVRRPVQGAEQGARRESRIGCGEVAGADATRHEGAHAALVTVALGDDQLPQARRQRVDFEMRR